MGYNTAKRVSKRTKKQSNNSTCMDEDKKQDVTDTKFPEKIKSHIDSEEIAEDNESSREKLSLNDNSNDVSAKETKNDVTIKNENKSISNVDQVHDSTLDIKENKDDLIGSTTASSVEMSNVEELKTEKTEDDLCTNEPMQNTLEVNKVENVLQTPTKADNIQDEMKVESFLEDMFNSPFSWSSQRTPSKVKTPPSCKKTEQTHTPKSNSKRKINSEHSDLENTPVREKKRKVSESSSYSRFCDTLKSEFADRMRISDFEAVELMHDFDTIINFEDSKLSPDVLLSSTIWNTVPQDTDEGTATEPEPSADPLFIDNHEENTNKKTRVKKTATAKDSCKQTLGKKKSTAKHKKKQQSKVYRQTRIKCERKVLKELNSSEEEEEAEEEEEKEEKLPQSVINKLRNLRITLTHKVPPQHKIETRAGTHALTQAQRREFEKHGLLRKGLFSRKEDEIIRRNWNAFCKTHDWDPENVKPFLHLRHNKKLYITKFEERLKFVQFLAKDLPWRTLHSVYSRFRTLYEKRIRARYTPKEDKTILKYMEKKSDDENKHHTKFAELSKILNRSRHSVWLRYQLLTRAPKKRQSTVTWTLPLIKEFLDNLLKITLSEDIEELKYAIIPGVIWQKMEKKLNIDQTLLKKFWIHQLHMQLFCKDPIYLNDIKIKLIEYIYGKGISHTREIIWPNVTKYFDGITTEFLCKLFFNLFDESHLYVSQDNFTDAIEYLYKEKIPEIYKDPVDKYLPRIICKENGQLEVLDDEEEYEIPEESSVNA